MNKEFIKELEYNQNINYKKGLENRIDINYVIERLQENDLKLEHLIKRKIKCLENRINKCIENNEDENMINEYSYRRLELSWLLDDIRCGQHEENN